MNKAIHKLKYSRTGASITFALLLFLVCAALCSVMLTAGSAAAGRMSRIAETDQRYYAVSSAAELLKDLVDQKTVSVVELEQTRYNTVYTNGVAGKAVKGETTTNTYLVKDLAAGEIDEHSLSQSLELSSITIDSFVLDAAKSYFLAAPVNNRPFALSSDFFTQSGLDYDALAVSVFESVDEAGNLSFTLYNRYRAEGEESDAGSRFTLKLHFTADESSSSGTKTETVSTTPINDSSYSVETLASKIKVTTLTWRLDEIKTNS